MEIDLLIIRLEILQRDVLLARHYLENINLLVDRLFSGKPPESAFTLDPHDDACKCPVCHALNDLHHVGLCYHIQEHTGETASSLTRKLRQVEARYNQAKDLQPGLEPSGQNEPFNRYSS